MSARPAAKQLLGLTRSLAVYYGQIWKPLRLRRFYARFVASGDLVFDIGAHVGNRTWVLAGLGARVVAVEPQALFHAVLRRLVAGRRVALIHAAVGAVPGRVTLRVSSRHPTVSTAAAADWSARVGQDDDFRGVRWDRRETVTCTTLDHLIAAHGCPAFCKIDVEGMEVEVLRGLSQPIARVAIEVLPAASDQAVACLDRLASLGPYRFNLVEGERDDFAWSDWCGVDAAKERVRGLRRPGDLYAFLEPALPPGPRR